MPPRMSQEARPAQGPLTGVTVVDLTRVLAGPYCTLVLAELGARVIKVERPGVGDNAREVGPHLNGKSAYFMSLNRGKESIALDLGDAAEREIFERLVARADVLVENYRPGVLAKHGCDWPRLHARWPRLILASISGFGQNGPYAHRPAFDMVVQAMGGVMSLTGHPGGPPTRVGTSIGDITAGLFGAIGVLAALHERATTGVGRWVDVAMLDSQVAILENAIARYAATGQVPGPLGARHPSIAPFAAFKTLDKPIVIAAGHDPAFRVVCAVLGAPELASDPRFATIPDRVHNADALGAEIEKRLATRTAADWLARLEPAGVPCGPLNDIAAVLADPQVRARHMIVSVDDPIAGKLEMPGFPVKLDGVVESDVRSPAPELDADRAAILAELERADDH
ncbi:MAG TPA: CoA transferase [Myxococcota bacterium]|nr:CoA transferase [Myxococcota bacterium]